MLSAIVAVAKNNIIGSQNELPWYLPADLKHFKDITTGHAVIMGRNTFASIVASLGHALPNRQNIVVSRTNHVQDPDVIVVTSIEEALATQAATGSDSEIFIIGGAQIYKAAAPFIEKWYVTEIDADIEGDVVLEGFEPTNYTEISRESHHKDDKNPYDYSFVVYERR